MTRPSVFPINSSGARAECGCVSKDGSCTGMCQPANAQRPVQRGKLHTGQGHSGTTEATATEVVNQAEQIVLGALMLDPGQIEKLPGQFTVASFRDHRHATIYAHLTAAALASEPTDPVALAARLIEAGDLQRVGGVPYLHTLVSSVPTAAAVHAYVGIVQDAAATRDLRIVVTRLAQAVEIEDPQRRSVTVAELAEHLTTSGTDRSGDRRRVELGPYLDGTYVAPQPTVGGDRDDNAKLLYAGHWHTAMALTTAGKSWFALWHAIAELRSGNPVAYAHFEEHSPAGTLDRIRALAPDLSIEDLRERFVWLDCSTGWKPGEFAAALPPHPALVVLDGINAACSQHGWPVNDADAPGAYMQMFVTPAVKTGAAVLSLGHPPKAKDRQAERHGYGASAWLDLVNGAAFRLEAAKESPIRRGHRGYSALFSVKDRPGYVEASGVLDDKREGGWYYLGAFTVDSSPGAGNTSAHLTTPSPPEVVGGDEGPNMPTPVMIEISRTLQAAQQPMSQNAVETLVKGRAATKRAALEFLVNDGYVARTKHGRSYQYSHAKPFLDPSEASQ